MPPHSPWLTSLPAGKRSEYRRHNASAEVGVTSTRPRPSSWRSWCCLCHSARIPAHGLARSPAAHPPHRPHRAGWGRRVHNGIALPCLRPLPPTELLHDRELDVQRVGAAGRLGTFVGASHTCHPCPVRSVPRRTLKRSSPEKTSQTVRPSGLIHLAGKHPVSPGPTSQDGT